jgi:hypothetical protein
VSLEIRRPTGDGNNMGFVGAICYFDRLFGKKRNRAGSAYGEATAGAAGARAISIITAATLPSLSRLFSTMLSPTPMVVSLTVMTEGG